MDRVLVVCGPTGVGKTKLSIDLAKYYDGEIINVDSMQIYKEMNIGTAKIKEEEKEGVPHHLFDIYSIKECANVADFQVLVRQKIEEVKNRNKLPILVGGTGLYVKASLYDYSFVETDTTENKYDGFTNDELYEMLKVKDPKSAEKFHANNRKRIIRSLEIVDYTGQMKSEIEEKQEHKLVYDALFLTLTMDREKLYERINNRVEIMMEEGLEQEVAYIVENASANTTALQAIGYKEFIPYFHGEYSLEQVIDDIKKNSRHYAKRQYTWFRNQIDANWIDITNKNSTEVLELAKETVFSKWGLK